MPTVLVWVLWKWNMRHRLGYRSNSCTMYFFEFGRLSQIEVRKQGEWEKAQWEANIGVYYWNCCFGKGSLNFIGEIRKHKECLWELAILRIRSLPFIPWLPFSIVEQCFPFGVSMWMLVIDNLYLNHYFVF